MVSRIVKLVILNKNLARLTKNLSKLECPIIFLIDRIFFFFQQCFQNILGMSQYQDNYGNASGIRKNH